MHSAFDAPDPIEPTVMRDIGRFASPRRNRSGPWTNPAINPSPPIDALTCRRAAGCSHPAVGRMDGIDQETI